MRRRKRQTQQWNRLIDAKIRQISMMRETLRHAHEWLETVEQERKRQGAGYIGLDHAIGEWPYCSICAAYLNTAEYDREP